MILTNIPEAQTKHLAYNLYSRMIERWLEYVPIAVKVRLQRLGLDHEA